MVPTIIYVIYSRAFSNVDTSFDGSFLSLSFIKILMLWSTTNKKKTVITVQIWLFINNMNRKYTIIDFIHTSDNDNNVLLSEIKNKNAQNTTK